MKSDPKESPVPEPQKTLVVQSGRPGLAEAASGPPASLPEGPQATDVKQTAAFVANNLGILLTAAKAVEQRASVSGAPTPASEKSFRGAGEPLPSAERLLENLRSEGWAVAVHNDYRQDGESRTFWLVTRGERALKGEGSTDVEALLEIESRRSVSSAPTPQQMYEKLLAEKLVWFDEAAASDIAQHGTTPVATIIEALKESRHFIPHAIHWAVNVAIARLTPLPSSSPSSTGTPVPAFTSTARGKNRNRPSSETPERPT